MHRCEADGAQLVEPLGSRDPIASVGLGGAKAGLGIGVWGRAGFFTARATLGQTFAHPLGATRERSWVGGEVEWSFYHLLSVQAGLQRPPDVKKGGRWLAAAGRPYVFLPPAK